MPAAKPAPELNIPHSDHKVDVSIINTTSYISGLPPAMFMLPEMPGLTDMVAPCYSFLIKHRNSSGNSKLDTLIFDLGVRKDFDNGPKVVVDMLNGIGAQVKTEKNVRDILLENGEDPAKVDAIIWSHHHFDHTGDPSKFPPSTDLIVGPGFKDEFGAGYPTVADSGVDGKAWEGRTLREIDFKKEGGGLKLGRYDALDFFGDGSFYLLDTPGHAVGHLCALARTSVDPPEFISMGGDIAHHGAEFRPTEYLPLPENIQPNPLVAPYTKTVSVCPGAIFENIHPNKSSTEPFMQPIGPVHHDRQQGLDSLHKWYEFDANANIFSVIAHDGSLLDVIDFYPKPANGWKKKGWQEQGRWRFLRDFQTGSEAHKAA